MLSREFLAQALALAFSVTMDHPLTGHTPALISSPSALSPAGSAEPGASPMDAATALRTGRARGWEAWRPRCGTRMRCSTGGSCLLKASSTALK